jgi:hypothetical protein
MATTNALRDRRGCEWDDFGDAFTLILVRASARETADAVAAIANGKVEAVDPHYTTEEHPNIAQLVFQHAAHDWSIFASTLRGGGGETGKAISQKLGTRAIVLSHEDTGGWSELRVFDKGRNVETYTWGPDYTQEFAEAAEELGEELGGELMPTDAGEPWDHRLTEDGNMFMFRSTERKVASASTLQDEKRMMDETLRANDAWLPSWSHFPWQKAPPDRLEFAGAFVVRMS